jgi:hypothetical protein
LAQVARITASPTRASAEGIISGMQPDYLARLSPEVSAFVQEVEAAAGVAIEVAPQEGLNTGGPFGHGMLKVEAHTTPVRLLAPTNGYFPDGAVRHEVLHVHRLRVAGVPRISLADAVDFAPEFEAGLTRIDNALEHLVIVPIELQHHPERRQHWEQIMARIWGQDLPAAPSELDRRIGACLHWSFLRHVMPGSPAAATAEAFMQGNEGLRAEADSFADQAVALLADKAALVRFFFDRFSELPREMAALEFVSSETGTRQEPIPGG